VALLVGMEQDHKDNTSYVLYNERNRNKVSRKEWERNNNNCGDWYRNHMSCKDWNMNYVNQLGMEQELYQTATI
jgi:hypothetical protein